MNTKLDNKYLEEYSHLESTLKTISPFISKHNKMNYIDFDYYTVHDLTLFSVEPDYDFNSLEFTTKKLTSILPNLKRIFSKPIITLKDTDDVLPVETVRIINQNTMLHLANHSSDVGDITSKGIKPRKLLTRIYDDDYSIYENVVFCNFIDETLSYCRKNIRIMKDLVYANEMMEFNLLERVNHLDYFLALGKLHTGYIRDFDKYYSLAKEQYKVLSNIYNTIQPRLIKPIYQKNKRRNRHLKLKKTNIFLMQKDYHQVYKTYKYFINNKLITEEIKNDIDIEKLKKEYFNFTKILTIFALGHFNFEIDPSYQMDLTNLDASFTFKKWSIRLLSVENKGILISIKKEKHYEILLVPSLLKDPDEEDISFKNRYGVDEVVICSPLEEDYLTRKTLFISMENIESFRRIQQLFLKGMIYSDTERFDCPFCHSQLVYNLKGGFYECETCKTQIKEGECHQTHKKYFYTTLPNSINHQVDLSSFSKDDKWLYDRKVEGSMFFRNITRIDSKGHIICPECGETVEKQ